jgi:thymidylate synthase
MRSSDFYEHFLNDMVLASWLNRWMAKQLEVKPGALVVYINSLHAYKINLDERKIF